MDTSKEYVLMCEKTGEIQELWDIDYGDYFNNNQGIGIEGSGLDELL